MSVLQVTDADSELKFRRALTALLEQHREVVTMLAEGFTDCRRHIQVLIATLDDFIFLSLRFFFFQFCERSLVQMKEFTYIV